MLRAIYPLAGLALLLLLPAFILGAGGSDLLCQSLRVSQFSHQLWQGEPLPKWLPDMFAGSGTPEFFFYPPLSYYIAALFAFLAPLDVFSFYPMAASGLVATLFSGVTFYYWLKNEIGEKPALWAAALYMATPFHLGHSFYGVLLYPTVWAYVWFPLMMLYAGRIARGQPGVAGYALSLGLLILTNIPSTILMAPLSVVYFLVCLPRLNGAPVLKMLGACLLGFGVSAFFLLPALFYMGAVNMDLHWANPALGYAKGFLSFTPIPFGLWSLALLLICLLYYFAPRTRLNLFCLVASLVAVFMNLSLSAPLWELLPILKPIEHPVRFYIIPSLCAAVLAGQLFPRKTLLSVLLLVSILITFWLAGQTRTPIGSMSPELRERYRLSLDQYAHHLTSPSLITRYFTKEGIADAEKHMAQAELLSGIGEPIVTLWQPRHIEMQLHASTPVTLRIHQMMFPGWHLQMEGKDIPLSRDEKTGLILATLPAGSGTLTLTLEKLLPEKAGDLLSLVSLALIVFLWQRGQTRRKGEKSMTPVFTITHIANAPRETVWNAWTDPKLFSQWFGPKGFHSEVKTLELRPGGILHSCLKSEDGSEMWAKFTYREVTPPSRLVWEHSFSDAEGNLTRHPMSPTWPIKLLTTVEFKDLGDKTEIHLTWAPLDANENEVETFAAAIAGMNQGWGGTFVQFDEFLAK